MLFILLINNIISNRLNSYIKMTEFNIDDTALPMANAKNKQLEDKVCF